MQKISQLMCLIGLLVFLATTCMARTVVNQDEVDDRLHDLINKRQSSQSGGVCRIGPSDVPFLRKSTGALVVVCDPQSTPFLCYVRCYPVNVDYPDNQCRGCVIDASLGNRACVNASLYCGK